MHDRMPMPVMVNVARPDGTTEQVRIGYAEPVHGGLLLRLADVMIADASLKGSARMATNSTDELERLAGRARRILADPAKASWHDEERRLLADIEAELARQRAANP